MYAIINGMKKHFKLGFFGAGKMAEGILAAAAQTKDFDPATVLMAEKLPSRAAELAKKYGVNTTTDAREVARTASIIFLAVRPQDLAALAADVKPLLTDKTLVVSIAAGKSLATLKKALGKEVRLVRVMPNLALRAKEGMCAICPAKNATPADVKKVVGWAEAKGVSVPALAASPLALLSPALGADGLLALAPEDLNATSLMLTTAADGACAAKMLISLKDYDEARCDPSLLKAAVGVVGASAPDRWIRTGTASTRRTASS